jgi:hypothetical protein
VDRRGFLRSILAAGMAPAIVRAASLMKPVGPSGILASDIYHRALLHGSASDIAFMDGAQWPVEVYEKTGLRERPLLVPSIITREALNILRDNLILTSRVNRAFMLRKISTELTIKKPTRFSASGL